jgi:molecular chaperone GrpE (heat shock protein)
MSTSSISRPLTTTVLAGVVHMPESDVNIPVDGHSWKWIPPPTSVLKRKHDEVEQDEEEVQEESQSEYDGFLEQGVETNLLLTTTTHQSQTKATLKAEAKRYSKYYKYSSEDIDLIKKDAESEGKQLSLFFGM